MKRTALSIFQVLGALALCGIALYMADSGVDFKWIVVGGFTLFCFGWVCSRTKEFWGKRWYWPTVGGTFLLHCVAVGLLQRNLPMLPGMDYAAIGFVETMSMRVLLLLLFA